MGAASAGRLGSGVGTVVAVASGVGTSVAVAGTLLGALLTVGGAIEGAALGPAGPAHATRSRVITAPAAMRTADRGGTTG